MEGPHVGEGSVGGDHSRALFKGSQEAKKGAQEGAVAYARWA